jgi:hypothetical protein
MGARLVVKGHTLRGEGAAYEPHERGGFRAIRNWGTGGTGFAVCTCGVTSEVLSSSTQRRAWHRGHKADVAKAQHEAAVTKAGA